VQPLWTDEPPDRAQWEWRRVKRSFSIKRRKAVVEELQYWNTALKNCFEKPEVPAEDEDTKVQELQAQFNSKYCDSIRENVGTIHEALKDGWKCGCPCSHHATIDLGWQSETVAFPSVFDIALSFQDTSTQEATTEHCWRKLQIKIEKTESDDVIPVALPVSPRQSSRAPSPMASTDSRGIKFQRLFGHSENKTPTQITVGATNFIGRCNTIVLIEDAGD
jgi:hypothetical protein